MALARVVAGVATTDIVYCWFLSVYAAFAVLFGKLFGRRCVVVVGGVDVAREPGIGYGLWLSPWKSAIARRALRSADLVLVVAESLRDDAMRLARYDGANIRYLPTGYDPSFWTPGESAEERRRGVLCVASVSGAPRLSVKGIDLLAGAARLLPEVPVTVIGVDASLVPGLNPPPNVTFLPRVPREELGAHYRAAKVYCQPSRREGLPNALCEAMLCGCVPVVTDTGACAHAVGETGFVTSPGDVAGLADAIRLGVAAPAGRGREARSRISALFPLERRKEELTALLAQLHSSS